MPHREGQDLAPDTVRMLHMMEAAKDAMRFATGRTRADLDSDRMFLRALVHCIQEIGEAAARVSEARRALVPAIPWIKIVGMRHRLVHVYYDINADLLWEVVARELEPLIQAVQQALGEAPTSTLAPPAREPPDPRCADL